MSPKSGMEPTSKPMPMLAAMRTSVMYGTPRIHAAIGMMRERSPASTSPRPGTRPMMPSIPKRNLVPGTRKASSRRNSICWRVELRKSQAPRFQRPGASMKPDDETVRDESTILSLGAGSVMRGALVCESPRTTWPSLPALRVTTGSIGSDWGMGLTPLVGACIGDRPGHGRADSMLQSVGYMAAIVQRQNA